MMNRCLWEQHREVYDVNGYRLRYLRFADYDRIMDEAGISDEDLIFNAHMEAKAGLGEDLSPEEAARRDAIVRKMPLEDLWAACFVEPAFEDGLHLRTWMYGLPNGERETFRLWLGRLSDSTPVRYQMSQYSGLFVQMGVPFAKDLDLTNVTVQQALVMFKSLKGALEEAAKQAEV